MKNQAKTMENVPYKELADQLMVWRQAAGYKSALPIFKGGTPLSFSYNTYMDFERGLRLPSIEQILEVTHFFSKSGPPIEDYVVALLWAKVQMPTSSLQTYFSKKNFGAQLVSPGLPDNQPLRTVGSIEPFHLDSTWVFDEQDRALMEFKPWLLDFIQRLSRAYPESIDYQTLGLTSAKEFHELVTTTLKPWVEKGRIVVTDRSIKLTRPHWYVPRSLDWLPFRVQSMQRVLEKLSESTLASNSMEQTAFYNLQRNVYPEAHETFLKRLRQIENEFLALPFNKGAPEETAQDQTFSLLIAFGKRNLKFK